MAVLPAINSRQLAIASSRDLTDPAIASTRRARPCTVPSVKLLRVSDE